MFISLTYIVPKKLVFNSHWSFLDTFNFDILKLFLMLDYCSVLLKMLCISVTLTLKIFLNAIIMHIVSVLQNRG